MDGEGRNYLTGSIMLSRNEDGSSPEEYCVKSVIGEGGSTVCYEAARILKDGSEETGKLKEFYPVDSAAGEQTWYYSLERLPNGQLVPCAGTIRKFNDMCRDYLSTYKLLRKVMSDNPKNEVLKNYIQQGEILYGCVEKESEAGWKAGFGLIRKKQPEGFPDGDRRRPTVYIWSPGVAGKGFDLYLEEVRKQPDYRPEERLRDILSVVDALTDCIKALHTAGLMHMDIKPSNFLVPYNSDFRIKPNNVSLFDINTLCSVDSEYMRISGTEGYRAPEVLRGRADNRSDIYSIGAMLFYAVVITKDISDGLYRDFYYSSIDQLVRNSELFRASETNSDAALMSRICRILEHCLAKDPRKRYQSCSELKEDLEKARKRLDKMLWTPVEKSKAGLTDPAIVIQKLLYQHPLYESVDDDVTDVNVLVIGSGTYGQKFIDICLQAGQMSGIHLNITAVSDEPEEDKEAYLRFRPGLPEFVNVDGASDGSGMPVFASLNFRNVSPEAEDDADRLRFGRNTQINRELVKNLIEEAVRNGREYHYIFVALGEDRISQSIARLCSDGLREWRGRSCPVCYVSQKIRQGRKSDLAHKLYPVCINETVNMETIDQNLGQMAFNAHISWDSTRNRNVMRERESFFSGSSRREKYNRASSLAFALSIKYKLHSVHIDCEDPQEAAELFSAQILEARAGDEEAKRKFNQLVDLEHRRWVLDKVADGWTAPRDEKGNLKLEDCIVRGSVKDEVNRTHPCLVRGSETAVLSSPEYAADHHAKWDTGEIDPNLDELDQMSVQLHRCFKQQANRLKNEGILQNPDLLFIQNRIPSECENVFKAFRQFQFALKNILNGVESYSRQYDYYQDTLKAALKELPDETRVKIEERLKVIERAFFPVVESNLYRDYKANDEVLIEKIPFILSYRCPSVIAMAFEDGKYQNGRNEAVFANVAAATVLCPEKINYLYCFDKDAEVELLIRKLDAVLNYFGKRKMHCGIRLAVSCLEKVPDQERELLQKELGQLQKRYLPGQKAAWFESAEIFDAAQYEESAEQFLAYLGEHPADLYDGGNRLFSSTYDNGMFMGNLLRNEIPYFEFDWRHKIFGKRIGCEYLRFVEDKSFIRIQDMFALMNAADNRFNLPEFADDYEALWKIYTGEYLSTKKFENGVGNWNRLCICLEKYEDERKPLAKIAVNAAKNPEKETFTYFLPEYTFSTAKKLLQKLLEYGIAENGSYLVNHASDTCRLELIVNKEYEQQMNDVFMNPQMLLPYYNAEVRKYRACNTDYVEIRCNDLTVTDVNLDRDGTGRQKYAFDVLQQLEKAHFISQLKQNPNNGKLASFVYSSPRIKQMLTSAGEILEVYAYYDVLKTGYFDDVASGYEFCWESGGVKNELDLVLTKGFRSIIVECKAVVELKLDYYHKLHSIADQFGIGTTKVLLGNTYAHSNAVTNDLNAMQRSRGKQLSIQTISDKDKIIHIGQTLKALMEEDQG